MLDTFVAGFESILSRLDTVSGYVLIAALVPIGFYLTIRSGFAQVRLIPHMFKTLFEPAGVDRDGNKNMSPFRAFCISAASRVGTANIAGVALAISMGGPGAVFWMWVTAIIGGATAFTESTLGQLFKVKDKRNFRGGPAYYIREGLKAGWLASLFAVIIAVTFGMVFNTVQSNSIADAVGTSFDADGNFVFLAIIGGILALVSGLIFIGGVHRISHVTGIIVPVMAVLYLGVGLVVVVLNIGALPGAAMLVVTEAFNPQAVAGGTIGSIIILGVQRGLYSNEAGIGSVPNAAATASASHPAKQGLVQTLGVYFDTLLLCSVTAFIILLSNPEYGDEILGAQLTQTAVSGQVGQWGVHFLTVTIFFFAFSSILGNYYFGETNIEYLSNGKQTPVYVYRVAVVCCVFLGAVASLQIVWTMANIFMVIMAFINLISIVILSPLVIKLLKNYMRQSKAGLEPVFMASDLPGVDGIEAWDGTDEVTTRKFWEARGRKVREDL